VPFIPHTPAETADMLAAIGVRTIEDLFDEIPAKLRVDGLPGVPAGLSEAAITRLMRERAARNVASLCFLGAGAYEHHIPAAVWEIATRGEFYSAYTPYQAEASQGTLQLIYEYQSMMAGLTGLDVSNASLYDGATAFAEACLMAVRSARGARSRRVLVPRYVNPTWRKVARALLEGQNVELVELAASAGRTDLAALAALEGQDFAALCVPYPNFLGGNCRLQSHGTRAAEAAR
jgi:glycine dehydrogenase subunit 1